MSSRERLQRLLGGAHLADLRKRLRSRYERGIDSGALTLTQLSEAERGALAGLLGRAMRHAAPASAMRMDIGALDAALQRAGLANTLREALEILDGPITNLTLQKASLQAQWNALHQACRLPQLAAWLTDARAMGLLKRLAGNDPGVGAGLCEATERVLQKLPAAGVARSRLAAGILGDAHALDQGRPVATLVLAVLRRHGDSGEGEGEDSAQSGVPPEESVREQWATAGVLVNELARPALFLNVSATGNRFPSGEPCYLSLRALLRAPPAWQVAGRMVFVCENPNLVAIAADALGTACAPLVCTDGMPAAAQRSLLGQLAAAGARLCYHGDFDWPGLRIGNWVMRAFNAQAWRFCARDYLSAVTAANDGWRSLGSTAVEAGWDATLAAAMLSRGWAIDEEAVTDGLLVDLAAAFKS